MRTRLGVGVCLLTLLAVAFPGCGGEDEQAGRPPLDASSTRDAGPDAATAPDAPPDVPFDAPPDATPNADVALDASPPVDAQADGAPVADASGTDSAGAGGLGDACDGDTDCASAICVRGACTRACPDDACPDGYECLEASRGGVQQNVCVPRDAELCTSCDSDAACSESGVDRCLSSVTGASFCARDCTDVGCPADYVCSELTLGNEQVHQCVPSSGACDCDASQAGAVQACSIATPFGSCPGSRVCGGSAGWSVCLPPATADAPDGSYADENCDGIDGDVADGVFVAPSGSDSSSCGLSAVSPCQTISHGIARAALESRHHVFVQAGTYPEVAVLADGIHVWGGYDTGWQRGPHADPAHRVVISGGQDVASGESMAVRARDILQAVTLGDLVIDAPDAVGTVNRNGRSSYGVHVQNATLRLERIAILGGNGAAGSEGADGADAEVVQRQPQMNGGVGGDGREYSTVCDTTSTGGAGPRGTNTCAQSPSQRDMDAGPGGAGGQMDTDCGWCGSCGTCGNCDARSGQNGSNADFVLGSAGLRGFGSSASSSCLPATDPHGKDGAVSNGAGGLRQAGGFTANGFWYARAGLAGATGANGGGGGGGGGSAGCDDGTDAYGPGGGGGAAGGCAARAGGQGGGGGGGSFGVFVASGNVTLAACAITRGIGGNGGRGGAGGRGQDGGLGGGPGANPGAAPAGRGGNGGHGGHAGGGAGGQGGRVAGIAWLPGAMVTQDCTMSGGVPGAAGPGGLHAPAAPLRDGNDGESGLPGTLEASRVCASAGEC